MSISNVLASSLRTGICTSTTRPTSPYVGQAIYETDTGKFLIWNGSTWSGSFIANSATTATSTNTASAIVARDSSGNFSAGVIIGTTNAASGRGVGILGGTGDTSAILQFLNNAANSQWANIYATNDVININAGTVNIPNLKGSVIQVVTNTNTTAYTRTDTSGTRVDVTNFNATITPKTNTSRIFILVQASAYSICDGYLYLTRSGTLVANPLMPLPRVDFVNDDASFFGMYMDSPATTSSTTYQIQATATGCTGIVYVNAQGGISRITLMEIST